MKQAKREPKTLSEVEISVLNSCGTAFVIRKKKICWSEVFGKNKHVGPHYILPPADLRFHLLPFSDAPCALVFVIWPCPVYSSSHPNPTCYFGTYPLKKIFLAILSQRLPSLTSSCAYVFTPPQHLLWNACVCF